MGHGFDHGGAVAGQRLGAVAFQPFEELSIALGGTGYNYEFFPFVRWTWTTPCSFPDRKRN